MDKLSIKVKIPSLDTLDDVIEKKSSSWKLYLLISFCFGSLIALNTIPGLKESLFNIGSAIYSIGWPGPLLIIMIYGILIIPLGMPCLPFEMILSLLIQSYMSVLSLCLIAKVLGATISYVLTKHILKDTIRKMFTDVKVYKCIQHAVEQSPFKFSLILRVTVMPLFLKNYGLAIPKSVTFNLYMICAFATAVPTTVINVYLIKQAGNISTLLHGTHSTANTVCSIVMIALSAWAFVYTIKYTKKVLRELEEKNIEDLEESSTRKEEDYTTDAHSDFKSSNQNEDQSEALDI